MLDGPGAIPDQIWAENHTHIVCFQPYSPRAPTPAWYHPCCGSKEAQNSQEGSWGWGQGGSRASPWSQRIFKDQINVCRAFCRRRTKKEPTKRFMAVIITRLCQGRERSAERQAVWQPPGNSEHPQSSPSSPLNVWMWLQSRFRHWSLFSHFCL